MKSLSSSRRRAIRHFIRVVLPVNRLERYPDQAATRKGYALTGAIFLLFGFVMLLWDSPIGMAIGFLLGIVLVLPAIFMGQAYFSKYEKLIEWISFFGIFS